ncbi:expansin family protein [Roridomyces roridus]|uniref:Expansin family protein n=1 Tax=Roridomyces roridus TaxID=1738132 RepID=A0AAD7BW40_9AGAR|nr:expansin family protein [Roridomyces roridus]
MRSLLALLALPAVLAGHNAHVNHRDVAKRASGDLSKRAQFPNTRWTFYSTGLGACGKTNQDSDFNFGTAYPSPDCFKMITMTYGGKTTQAQIVDACPGCPPNGLDLSPGLFSFFADQGLGVITGWRWRLTRLPPRRRRRSLRLLRTPPRTPLQPPPPLTRRQPPPPILRRASPSPSPPKSSSAAPPPSSSAKPSPSPSAPTSSSAPAASPAPATGPENLDAFAQVLLELTNVVVAGANAH